METTLKLHAPDDVQAELKISGTIGELRMLNTIIREMNEGSKTPNLWRHPMREFIEALTRAISAAEEKFTVKHDPS